MGLSSFGLDGDGFLVKLSCSSSLMAGDDDTSVSSATAAVSSTPPARHRARAMRCRMRSYRA